MAFLKMTEEYMEACVALAMEAEGCRQADYRAALGEEIYAAAYSGWQDGVEVAIREQQAGENAYVLVENGEVTAFGAFRSSGVMASLGSCQGPALDQLLIRMLDEMKAQGITHVAANCDCEPSSQKDMEAFAKAGFVKELPHVRYFQVLKERPELPATEVQIVPAQEEHVAPCVEIALKLWTIIHGEYAKRIGDDIHDVTGAGWQDAHRINIANQQRKPTSLVALLDGKVVGFCGCRVENGVLGVIGYNGVDPAYRGRGIARYLYEAAFDSFRNQGIRCARVYTGRDDGHGPARRAYEKAGFDKKIINTTYYKIL